jgi:uncharacterized protein (TIGR04255 family)
MNSAPATTVPQSPYPNAPIIEAVIEIRVEYSDAAAAAVHRAAFVASLSSEFPRKETMQRHEIQVEVSPEGPPQVGKKETAGGWRLYNEKSDRVLVLLSDTATCLRTRDGRLSVLNANPYGSDSSLRAAPVEYRGWRCGTLTV